MTDLAPEDIDAIYQSEDTELQEMALGMVNHPYHTFRPIPDDPNDYQESTAFVNAKDRFAIALGGTGCLGGEELIYDPVANAYRRVDSIRQPFNVISRTEEGRFAIGRANRPYRKGTARLYRFHLSNGGSFVATMEHRILTAVGYLAMSAVLNLPSAELPSIGGKTVGIVSHEFVREDKFYDFTVEKYHNYFLAGLFHHNSGKTHHAAWKMTHYLLTTRPPRPDCPAWVIGDSLDTTIDVCWKEKLSQFIPEGGILDIHWNDRKRGRPAAITLRHPDDPTKPGWVIEFKSYNQGMQSMKAASIGFAWMNEECPYSLVAEVQGRTREYNSPMQCDFTPIESKDPQWAEAYEDPPPGWRFYHLNTRRNSHLAEGWADWYLSQIPEDMRDLRTYGVFSVLKGQVFKEFRKAIHVIEPFEVPGEWFKIRGIDFGFNNPFVCVWICRDKDGRYYIYDEHYEVQKLNQYHADAIKGRGRFSDRLHRSRWRDNTGTYGPTYTDHDAQERAELGDLGILCTCANKSINAGLTVLRSLMMVQGDGRPKFYVTNNCKNTIREIGGYKWPEGTAIRSPKDVPLDVANHCIDSFRYGIFSDYLNQQGGDQPVTRTTFEREKGRHGVLLHGSKR